MNQLFVESLKKYTHQPYELIVVDNGSTDGSLEFFRSEGARIIENKANYSYSYCQNQGIELAQFEYLAFLNNDILLSRNWDERAIKLMQAQQLEVLSFATNDRLETKEKTRAIRNRWKLIKNPLKKLFGTSRFSLKAMHKLMYGNWDTYTEQQWQKNGDRLYNNFSGSCILMNRSALDKIGLFDDRIQSADFDLYCRTKKRSLEQGDIKPLQLALGIYIHHYGRLTLRSKDLVPFVDKDNIISIKEKWGAEAEKLLKGVQA